MLLIYPFSHTQAKWLLVLTPDQQQALQATRGLFDQTMALDPRANLAQLAIMGTPTVQSASLLDTFIARYQDPYKIKS